MMMQRRHLRKIRFPGWPPRFVNLNTDTCSITESLENKYAADERQQKFLLGQDRDRSQAPPIASEPDIAHKNLGRRRVVPKKPETRPDHRPAKDRQFRRCRIVRNIQTLGPPGVAREICQTRSERTSR